MRVLIRQLDGKMPNVALMRLAAYHLAQGDEVDLADAGFFGRYERVYGSVVFTKNRGVADSLKARYPRAIVGGTGVDLRRELPPEVEATKPAYDFWGVDYSIGFTSRGCPRRCPYCVVPEKEGDIRPTATIDEVVGAGHDRLILLDNNFLASPLWRERLEEIRDRELRVSFCQGLDIRLVDDEVAERLRDVRYHAINFDPKARRLYFAFDNLADEAAVRRGVETLERYGHRRRRLMFYVLVNYPGPDATGCKRVAILDGLGVDPFIMIYGDAPASIRRFARSINRRFNRAAAVKWRRGLFSRR